jgi:hypothetical protein
VNVQLDDVLDTFLDGAPSQSEVRRAYRESRAALADIQTWVLEERGRPVRVEPNADEKTAAGRVSEPSPPPPKAHGGCSDAGRVNALWLEGVSVRRTARLLDLPVSTVRRHLRDRHCLTEWPTPPSTSARPRGRPNKAKAVDHAQLRRPVGALRESGMDDRAIARKLMVSTRLIRKVCGRRRKNHETLARGCTPCTRCGKAIFLSAYTDCAGRVRRVGRARSISLANGSGSG